MAKPRDVNDILREEGEDAARTFHDASEKFDSGGATDARADNAASGTKIGDWVAPIDDAAFHGLAGKIVGTLEPHTEADPLAILFQFLASFGNAIGRTPYYRVEGDRHHTNLFTVFTGPTSKGRKGTSAGRIQQIMEVADPTWMRDRVHGGLSSGEGVIWAVRDPIRRIENGEAVDTDPGVSDKRLMVFESEFAGVLQVMQRQGNILSRLLRDAWDRGNLASLTKNAPARATAALVSIIGHITIYELQQCLDRVSMANGFANRLLFVCVRRSKFLPHGGALSDAEIVKLGELVKEALGAARRTGRVQMTGLAAKMWEELYPVLSAEVPGLLGALTARAEAQVIRLALLYALLDHKRETITIDVPHLRAAVAAWEYCAASTAHIFGEMLGDPIADEILSALRQAGNAGMTRTDISARFARNRSSGQINLALTLLAKLGKAKRETKATESRLGRPAEVWTATTGGK